MSRNYIFSQDEYYHIYSRGYNKAPVFLDLPDYKRFVSLIYLSNSQTTLHRSDQFKKTIEEITEVKRGLPLVSIGAYCLMPNHFHILVRGTSDGGISKFMQKIMTGYTMYFNKRYERTGGLFGSTFKAVHVATDEHLKYLFSYIHLNPVKLISSEADWGTPNVPDSTTIKDFLSRYEFSSIHSYLSRPEIGFYSNKLLDKENFPEYFSEGLGFDDFLEFFKGLSRI